MGFEPQKPKQNNRKLCPLTFNNPNVTSDCEYEKCQWWIEIQKCCSIKLIATSFGNMDYREKQKRRIENLENPIEGI